MKRSISNECISSIEISKKHRSDMCSLFLRGMNQILQYTLIDYLIKTTVDCSNRNIDCVNLLLLSKTVNEIILPIYMKRGKFAWHDAIKFDSHRKAMIQSIVFDKNIFIDKHMLTDFPKVIKVTLGDKYNYPLLHASLPDSLTELYIGRNYTYTFRPKLLPPNLKELEFGSNICLDFNFFLTSDYFPDSLTSLKIGPGFNNDIKINTFPPNLTHLNLTNFNNILLPGVLPKKLRKLFCGHLIIRSIMIHFLLV